MNYRKALDITSNASPTQYREFRPCLREPEPVKPGVPLIGLDLDLDHLPPLVDLPHGCKSSRLFAPYDDAVLVFLEFDDRVEERVVTWDDESRTNIRPHGLRSVVTINRISEPSNDVAVIAAIGTAAKCLSETTARRGLLRFLTLGLLK